MLLRHAHTEGIQRLYLPSFVAVISEKIVIEIIIVCAIFLSMQEDLHLLHCG